MASGPRPCWSRGGWTAPGVLGRLRQCSAQLGASGCPLNRAGSVALRMVDIARLIEAVRQRPCLWDQYCKEYYNREQIAKNWVQIGEILGIRYEQAKSKWKHLRDNYRSELKKILKSVEEEEDESARYQTSWVWFDSLQFLREFVFSKCNRNNRNSVGLEDPSNMVNIKVEPDFDFEIDEPSASSEQSEPSYRVAKKEGTPKKRRTACEADTEDRRKRHKTEEVEDDSYYFVMSILPSFRRLPVHSQMLIKAKIHDLIYQEYIKSQNDK